RRRRHAEVGELREEELDRLRGGALVHAVERLAVAAGGERRDELVRQDHQLLDEHVRVRLAFEPRVGHAAVLEAEDDLGRGDLERTAREAAATQLRRDLVRELELLAERTLDLASLRLSVREPRA